MGQRIWDGPKVVAQLEVCFVFPQTQSEERKDEEKREAMKVVGRSSEVCLSFSLCLSVCLSSI